MIKEKNLEKLIHELKNYDYPIIVEGKNDKLVLENFDVRNVYDISGKNLEELSEEIVEKTEEVLILTDFDEEGRRKASFLNRFFETRNIRVNKSLRKRIKFLVNITKIEDLIKISKFWRDVYHGKISSIHDKICNRSRILNRRNCRKTRRDRRNIWADRRSIGTRSRFKRITKSGKNW